MITDAAQNVKEEGTAFQGGCTEKILVQIGETVSGASAARKSRGIYYFFFSSI